MLDNQYQALQKSDEFQTLKTQLIQLIGKSSEKVHGVRGPRDSSQSAAYEQLMKDFSEHRGRPLFFPFIGSGIGSGPFMELADGSVKYDMITGIGVNFFGHSHPALIEEMIDALPADVMQGNLQPGDEPEKLLKILLNHVGSDCRLKHGWIMGSGSMVNEISLKMIRQKKAPATRVIAFEHCFAGRSTAMQEVSYNKNYRVGQPTYEEVSYLPFYDEALGLEKSVENTLASLEQVEKQYPGKNAALMMEMIQGEGGFRDAPREFYVQVFEAAKKLGLAIWLDEVQTFGRTGELFAFQKYGVGQYVDVVTIGKLSQSCVSLFTEEYNPQPGLVAGTFSGSTSALRAGRRIIEILIQEGHLGPEGKIEKLSQRFRKNLDSLAEGSCQGKIGIRRTVGGMIGFAPFDGSIEKVKAVVNRLYENGVMAFSCGHGPVLVRLLPPLPVMTEEHVDDVCSIIEKTLHELS